MTRHFYLLALLATPSAYCVENLTNVTLPNTAELRALYRSKKPVACYAFIDEGANFQNCIKNSTAALSTSNVSYEDFTLGQLRLLATRSKAGSARMKYAKQILRAIGQK